MQEPTMRPLYEIHDSRPAEKSLHIALGLISLCGGLFYLLHNFLEISSLKTDWVKAGAAVLLIIAGLWALMKIPQLTLQASRKRLLLIYGAWPLSMLTTVRISNDDIIILKPVEHDPVDYPVGSGVRGERTRSESRWRLRGTRYGKGIHIGTTRGNFVISCRNPAESADRLKKIVGLE